MAENGAPGRQSASPPDHTQGLTFPHDLPAERALLGCCLVDPDCWRAAADAVDSGDFYAPRNAEIWRAMRALTRSGGAIDTVLLRGQLESTGKLDLAGGDEYLLQIGDVVPTVQHAEQLALRIRDLGLIRGVQRACLRLAAEGGEPIDDIPDYLDRASTALGRVCDRRVSGMRSTKLVDALHAEYGILTERSKRGASLLGHSCGLKQLDDFICGFVPGDLIVLGARPGHGKTALAAVLKLGIARSTGLHVLSLELEMLQQQLIHRLWSSETGIELRRIRSANVLHNEMTAIARISNDLAKLQVSFVAQRGTRLSDFAREARRISRESRLGLIVVDYLQLARTTVRSASREQEISEISRELKSMAGEFDVPVVALSQLNREVEKRGANKRPQLSDLRESGAIEQDADTVLFLHREELYNPNTPDRGFAELIVAKQRSGALGTVRLRWLREYTRFEDADEPMQDPQRGLGYEER